MNMMNTDISSCIQKCREMASTHNCRQIEHTTTGSLTTTTTTCIFFAFATAEIGAVTPFTTCVTVMDMFVFTIPEASGFGILSSVRHTPTGGDGGGDTNDGEGGEGARCASQSNPVPYNCT